MKIVILDGYTTNPGDLSWDWLSAYGDVTVYDRTPQEKIAERTRDAEIVITNKTPLGRPEIDQMLNLRFVALLSTGYNVVDGAYLRQKGIPVSNIPAYSTGAVAQLVFAFLTAFTNRVALQTLGIIGFGGIGQKVADIAAAFDMHVLAVSGHETDQSARKNFQWTTLEDLAAQSDFITLHCPLTERTENLVDAAFLARCKPTAYLINTARGPVVDAAALADALNEGRLAGAGLDVLTTEPPAGDNPLLHAKNCLITPHIAWAGYETRARLMSILKENFAAFAKGTPIHVVN